MLRRGRWISLDGPWEFAIEETARASRPGDVRWDRTILVPFAPETPASGIGETGFFQVCWYRRRIAVDPEPDGGRWLLHFGAVDYAATVW